MAYNINLCYTVILYMKSGFKSIMEVIRTKLGEGGRIIIPASFRQDLHLTKGDDIILHMQEDAIYITTPNHALHKLQQKAKKYVNSTGNKISLVQELLSLRRAEMDYDQ